MSSTGNGSTRSTRQQDQSRRPAPKRQENTAPNNRNGCRKPQGTANGIPRSPAESRTEFVPPKPKKKNPLNFSKPNPEFVTIFVGPQAETKPFKIHLDAIIHYSPYFKAAFTSEQCDESRTKVMKVENVEEKVFGLFNNWLYTQEILHADAAEPDLMELAKLWTAAGQWGIPSLQNQAMAELAKLIIDEPQQPTNTKDSIVQQFLIHAYSTKEDTALKRLAVHKMIRVLPCVISPKEWITGFPDGMMADIAEALMKHHQSLPEEHKTPTFLIQHFMLR